MGRDDPTSEQRWVREHCFRATTTLPTLRARNPRRAESAGCGELIADGAGWTDPERQQPVGDIGRHEPRQLDAIVDAELERALADPDPLRGIAQL